MSEKKNKFDKISAGTMREIATENNKEANSLLDKIESLAKEGTVSVTLKDSEINNDMRFILNGLGYTIMHNGESETDKLEWTITW
jgi:hypothetical protein